MLNSRVVSVVRNVVARAINKVTNADELAELKRHNDFLSNQNVFLQDELNKQKETSNYGRIS